MGRLARAALSLALIVAPACSNHPRKGSGSPAAHDAQSAAHDAAVSARWIATTVALGLSFSCALSDRGEVRCWGQGDDGQLGTGARTTVGDDEPPSAVAPVDIGGVASSLTVGDAHACVLLATHRVRCWGRNNHGQLGYGHRNNIGDDEVPASAGDVALDEEVDEISARGDLTCARLRSGAVRCWGRNSYGALGYGRAFRGDLGDDEPVTTPPAIRFGKTVRQLEGRCALFVDGSVTCWGGTAGETRTADIDAPSATQLALGPDVHPARMTAGEVPCFIESGKTALCYQEGASFTVPAVDVVVPATESKAALARLPFADVIDAQVDMTHGCVLLANGAVKCWGIGKNALLGAPDGPSPTVEHALTIDVGVPAAMLAIGNARTCVVTVAGGVRCWGYGRGGLLGYGSEENVGQRAPPSAEGDVPL